MIVVSSRHQNRSNRISARAAQLRLQDFEHFRASLHGTLLGLEQNWALPSTKLGHLKERALDLVFPYGLTSFLDQKERGTSFLPMAE